MGKRSRNRARVARKHKNPNESVQHYLQEKHTPKPKKLPPPPVPPPKPTPEEINPTNPTEPPKKRRILRRKDG